VRLRWVLALAGVAGVFAALTIAAALRYVIPILQQSSLQFDGTEDQETIDAYFAAMQSGYVFSTLIPWLATAAVVAGVAALALAARRAQLAAFSPPERAR
jgi:ABC-type multidrug transport system permease subunit